MKKLEDIPKKEIFNVPDGYFEKLPGIIQSRVITREKESKPVWSFALRYALPAVILLVIGIFWLMPADKGINAEQVLASIETEELVAYINDSDITTDELLANLQLNDEDANEIEGNVYQLNLDDENLNDILDEMEIDNF
jgi:hypothetical protein